MGMFDTVTFECPACHAFIHEQSKAGECLLREYSQHKVPVAIAAQLYGDEVVCPDCGKRYEIDAEIPPMQCISTTLKEIS